MYPSFFGKYTSSFQVAENQSTDLEKNDLQIGVGTADNTGSSVEFSSMIHSMGIVNLTLSSKTVPSTRVFKPGSTSEKLFDRAPTTSITATSNFTASVASNSTNSYKKSTGIYLLVGKPSTTVTFTGNSSEKYTWNATYTFSKNTGNIKTATPSREYDNAGWGFDYTGAVQTFTAPITGTYKLEVWGAQGGLTIWHYIHGPGYGGYSVGQMSYSTNQKLYICVGGMGSSNSGVQGGVGGYNGGGKGGNCNLTNFTGGGGGGGCSHIATSNYGELVNYNPDHLNDVLIVAGGGGGGLYSGSNLLKGDGGGISGINAIGYGGQISYGGSSSNYYKIGKGKDGSNGTGNDCSSEGNGGGGGGYYGGLTYTPASSDEDNNNTNGGGGSGFLSSKLRGASTIAGNTSFTSPSGGTETGHNGNGYAIITQVSY